MTKPWLKNYQGQNLKLELAKPEHINQISNLVNEAYRGKTGWTKETDLVQGNRRYWKTGFRTS